MSDSASPQIQELEYESRLHRRRRMRRRGRRAYIRSVYFLPSMATLGNAVCGFAAMYVASLATASALATSPIVQRDHWTRWWGKHGFVGAASLIFIVTVFRRL